MKRREFLSMCGVAVGTGMLGKVPGAVAIGGYDPTTFCVTTDSMAAVQRSVSFAGVTAEAAAEETRLLGQACEKIAAGKFIWIDVDGYAHPWTEKDLLTTDGKAT